MSSPYIVIYSHGFGVRKDDRGLFTDIAAALPNAQHIMFDYNQVDENTNNLTVTPLDEQAERLRQIITKAKADNPGATIDLICHSQGCVVACLAKPEGVRRAVFTGPPAELSVDDMIRIFTARPGSEINLDDVSRLQRADFSTTTVSPDYWKSIEHIDPITLYNEFAKTTELIVINGTEDEIIGSKDFSRLSPSVRVIEIKTGHNFEGEGRGRLLKAVRDNLHSVPFVRNPDDRCTVAVIGMVLAYFMPERHFTMSELENICGYEKGRSIWKAESMLNLARMGFQLHWVEDFDHHKFMADPKSYLRSILDNDAYQWQITHGNLEKEAGRIKQYIENGLPLEQRQATAKDIKRFLDDDWLVHLEVNANTLSGKSGYEGHSVLVIGYDDIGVTIHNPDGVSGNKPNQHVSWELLDKAWREFGGSYSLYAFKK